jgi:abortive infection bacteriophage resistance protein
VISNVKYQLPKNKNNRSKKKRAKYIVTLPPAAKILDGVSFGVLSKIFAGLAHSDTKIKIANYYQLPDPIILSSWLHSINTVRNICAHHGQLWNKRLQPTPFNLSNRKLSSNWLEYKIQDNTSEKLYLVTCCICYLLRQVNPRTQFASDLKSIFERFPHTPLEPIGFPLNWQSDRFWNLNLVLSNK